MAESKVGRISHYYDKIGVAIIDLQTPLKLGDKLTFKKGDEEVATQVVESIQIDREGIEAAKKGDVVGIHVDTPIKPGVVAYK